MIQDQDQKTLQPAAQGGGFRTQLRFFKDDIRYKKEKPYGFKVPPDDFPHSNITIDFVDDVYIKDMRLLEEPLAIDRNGLMVAYLKSELSYADYHDARKVQTYFKELEDLLKAQLGASSVQVFRHAIRKRDINWPRATEDMYEFDQPTTVVHIDATLAGCKDEIKWKNGQDEGEKLCQKHFQWFNIWKPLRAPSEGLNDWPLLVCDASTIDRASDLTPADLIYPTHATENTQVYHRSRYQWYYLSGQKTDEVIIFKQSDSDETSCPGVPHCSAHNPLAPATEEPRESIEVRALAFYD